MERAPFFQEVAEGPAGGTANWVEAEDGVRLRVGHWPAPGEGRGTVLLFTGRTEYIEKYGHLAARLSAMGLATLTCDWRGQGLSERSGRTHTTGHVDAFADYQHDVRAMLAQARALDLPRPYFLLAHSMGGCIGLRALLDGLPVESVIFTAPMWGIQLSSVLRTAAWGLSSIARPLRFGHLFAPGQGAEPYISRAAFEVNTLTSDPARYDYLLRQLDAHPELALGGPSLQWLNESLREMHRLSRRRSPKVPCACFLGSEEAIVDPERIRERMRRWPRSELVMLEGGRHEVLMERDALRERILQAIETRFAAREPA